MSSITCYDSKGNVLKQVYQWDENRVIKVQGLDVSVSTMFHFCNTISKSAIVVEPTVSSTYLVATVPNALLEQPEPIFLYIYQNTSESAYRTVNTIRIPVVPRPKPDAYVEPTVAILTYKSEDGTTTYQTYTSINGDDGRYYSGTPTKDPSGIFYYEWDGWSLTIGGDKDPDAEKDVTSDRTIYAHFVRHTTSGWTVHFMNYYYGDPYELVSVEVLEGHDAIYPSQEDPQKDPAVVDPENYEFSGWSPPPTDIREETWCYAQFTYNGEIQDSWATISARSAAGTAENYYSIGDAKKVTLNGTAGTLQLDNVEKYVYIIDFDHNSTIEGTGITFGCFKNHAEKTNQTDQCLVDSYYSTSSLAQSGALSFTFNHWRGGSGMSDLAFSYGGWKGCDMRYDVLGSTNVPPSGYSSKPVEGRVGYDATATCATNPVNNTLMSCLPSDLRAVMKPITKYTDNVGGGSGSVEANVTTSVDYLPLMSAYEVFGSNASVYYNSYESASGRQTQYAYYASGNSVRKRRYESDYSAYVYWWNRSPSSLSSNGFSYTDDTGAYDTTAGNMSFGLSPVFLV